MEMQTLINAVRAHAAVKGPADTIVDPDWGKEHRVTLDNGVVTSYPRDQMQQATQYMMSLIAQGISFSYSFKL